MGNNDIIAVENYDFLKGNKVKVKVLQEIMAENKPMVVGPIIQTSVEIMD